MRRAAYSVHVLDCKSQPRKWASCFSFDNKVLIYVCISWGRCLAHYLPCCFVWFLACTTQYNQSTQSYIRILISCKWHICSILMCDLEIFFAPDFSCLLSAADRWSSPTLSESEGEYDSEMLNSMRCFDSSPEYLVTQVADATQGICKGFDDTAFQGKPLSSTSSQWVGRTRLCGRRIRFLRVRECQGYLTSLEGSYHQKDSRYAWKGALPCLLKIEERSCSNVSSKYCDSSRSHSKMECPKDGDCDKEPYIPPVIRMSLLSWCKATFLLGQTAAASANLRCQDERGHMSSEGLPVPGACSARCHASSPLVFGYCPRVSVCLVFKCTILEETSIISLCIMDHFAYACQSLSAKAGWKQAWAL